MKSIKRAVFPGSFDPFTNGHLDVLTRATSIFDKVCVVIMHNSAKTNTRLFSLKERLEIIKSSTNHLNNVCVDSYEGLLVEYMKKNQFSLIVRGLRAVSDYEYELQIANLNRDIGQVETIFVMADKKWSYLSSSMVKEVASFGFDVSQMVPKSASEALKLKFLKN